MTKRSPDIGLVGLGLVGTAYAERLARADVRPVVVHDQPASEIGDRLTHVHELVDLRTMTDRCETAMLTVYSTEQVRDILAEIVSLRRNPSARIRTVLCASTLEPDAVPGLYATAREGDVRFVEYPVSGTSAQIRAGEGVGLLSGDESVIRGNSTLIEILTPKWLYVGGEGAASFTKLVVNLVLEVNRSALAEGLALAASFGLDPWAAVDALRASAAYSRVMDGKASKMVAGDFTPEGRASQSLKDVEIMLTEAARRKQNLPLASTQAELLREAVAAGSGGLDSSVVYRVIRRKDG